MLAARLSGIYSSLGPGQTSVAAMAASLGTVFMLRAVPFFAAGMRSLDAAMPDRSGHKSRDARGEGWALEIKTLAVASIAPPDNLVDEAPIGLERVEIARPAQEQRVLYRPLQMAVRAFDGAVLVR